MIIYLQEMKNIESSALPSEPLMLTLLQPNLRQRVAKTNRKHTGREIYKDNDDGIDNDNDNGNDNGKDNDNDDNDNGNDNDDNDNDDNVDNRPMHMNRDTTPKRNPNNRHNRRRDREKNMNARVDIAADGASDL